MTEHREIVDVVGVGIGPANLSLAALSHPLRSLTTRFYDQAAELAWHAGLLFPESLIQTSYLKDLVTPIDPTSPFSFLAFLVKHGRFYAFLTAAFPRVSRLEFGQYLAWVSRSLPSLRFDSAVHEIAFDADLWRVATRTGTVHARDLVLGTGLQPHVPAVARPLLGPTLHHAIETGRHRPATAGRRVAVIGGGQSGAEVIQHVLANDDTLPSHLVWVSRRDGFPPMDDSPFANELFTPTYSDHFYQLGVEQQRAALRHQTLASDGVSASLLEAIYRRLYAIQHVDGRRPVRLLPGHDLVGVTRCDPGWELTLRSADGRHTRDRFDVVVLATGHRYAIPACLEPILGRLDRDGDQLRVRADFSVVWDGPAHRRIFLQNGARHQRGVADPNLSLVAWRSAMILNRLAGREVYDCHSQRALVEWPTGAPGREPDELTARASA